MTKTYGEVWALCRSLSPLERRTFTLLDQMPEAKRECPPDQALVLFLADALRFEGQEPLKTSAIIRHFLDELLAFGKELAQKIAAKAKDVPVYRLNIADGRFVNLLGTAPTDRVLDAESWVEIRGPVPELRIVSYNLTTLMLALWGDVPLSGRLQSPETTDDSNTGPAGDAAAGG